MNLNALDSRFLSTCCSRLESVTKAARQMRAGVYLKAQPPVFSLVTEWPCDRLQQAANATSSASTETVPDSILERSRISVIRLSRSVPAPWMVRANSTCLAVRLPPGLSLSCCPRTRMLFRRRAQFMRHVCQKLRFVFGGQRQLLCLALKCAARLLNLLVLAFHLDVLFGQLLCLLRKLFVGLLQLFLLRLQFGRQLLRLFQQPFGLHRRFDAVEHDADTGCQLFKKRELQRSELLRDANSMTAFTRSSNRDRKNNDIPRGRFEQARPDGDGVGRHIGDHHAPFFRGALPDQAFADPQSAQMHFMSVIRKGGKWHHAASSSLCIW